MARFGIEGIRYFGNARAAGFDAEDLTYVFNICNGLDEKLRDSGHTRAFYWANDNCWEIDLRSTSLGGSDDDWSDDVDLFFITTHGRNDSGNASLLFNVQLNQWVTSSAEWRLGNDNIEWLLVYGCHTVDRNNPVALWNIFQRLHHFCGAWGDMWDSITTDEVGEDVGNNLTDGDTVTESWIDGVSDWWFDNHPIVVAAERETTWNGGNFDWPNTTLNRDHLWGHGTTVSDTFPNELYWLSWRWTEG